MTILSFVQGLSLYMQQTWALIVKRVISAKRDRVAVWTQLLVPILLVLVALLSGKATSNFPQEPPMAVNRWNLALLLHKDPCSRLISLTCYGRFYHPYVLLLYMWHANVFIQNITLVYSTFIWFLNLKCSAWVMCVVHGVFFGCGPNERF